jgi:hypothetical protein
MKDYYDLFKLAQQFPFVGATLAHALRSTLERRKTPVPSATPDALSIAFARDPAKRIQWRSFVTKNGLEADAAELESVIETLREFLMPVLNALAQGKELSLVWKPESGWQGR